ncbi:hypothetical protein PSI9734_02157 [Pseudidiomarina piscicola]|uniref:DUF3016 domain-containing protein n=1 Tax=Pseudidiomarina piscicola TaxID=2614830 RepID=A0A6S6WLW5_9GAMM|nr:DUF3016 domain-containing protein [Pseudidiomarina piscicola]CAB0151792.1 hypothetical protein PSI9734_02157 [Pseudidiomarina piscicola]VZT41244.1 hypothetical protein PSI9734_02157 [Pseudomonas aeruginosa]
MKKLSQISLGLAAAILSTSVYAAEVTVKWQGVEDYRDIEAVSDIQERFQNRIMNKLTEHWQELGAKLPAANTLAITMTDLDLTGHIEPTYGMGGSGHIRVLDSVSYPTMSFSYTYKGANGEVIAQEADVRLKDLGDRSASLRNTRKSGSDNLFREKRLMTEWVQRQFDVR